MTTLLRAPDAAPAAPQVAAKKQPAPRSASPSANTTSDGSAGPGTDSPGKQTRLNYRPDIDGIRGAAAIMVMGFHAKVPGFEGAYIGLDLFFVVSGFVILNLLIAEHQRTGGIRWANFYARRARRLIPAKATMLLVVLIVSMFLLDPIGAQQETAESAGAAAVFGSNFYFWKISDVSYFGHEPGTGVLLHTWSLSVEEQFYLALPFLILAAAVLAKLFSRSIHLIGLWVAVALAAGSLALAIAWAQPYEEAAYYLPITRAYEFLIGVALALLVKKFNVPAWGRWAMGFLGLALIAAVLIQPMPTAGYPTYWALIPCFGAFFLVWAGTGGSTPATKFLSNPLFVSLGLVSYGWYLWHWPFLVIGESVNVGPTPLGVRVVLVLLALATAILSYKFIEGRFYKRDGSKNTAAAWAPQRIVVTGVSTMALVATAAGVISLAATERSESANWQAVAAEADDIPSIPLECATRDEQIPRNPGACFLNEFDPDRGTAVIWGDSHAWMYIPAIKEAAKGRSVNLVAFTMGTCPPFDARGMTLKPCEQNNVEALEYVEELHEGDQPLQVILGGSWSSYFDEAPLNIMDIRNGNPQHTANVEQVSRFVQVRGPRLFRELGEMGVDVDVISPTPEVPRSAPQCLTRVIPLECDTDRATWENTSRSAVAWLNGQRRQLSGQSRLIDVTNEFCDAEACRAEVDGTVVYFDDNHLSATFARQLAPYFQASVYDAVTGPAASEGFTS